MRLGFFALCMFLAGCVSTNAPTIHKIGGWHPINEAYFVPKNATIYIKINEVDQTHAKS